MWFFIVMLIGIPVAKHFVKKQVVDGAKASMAIAGIEMAIGAITCFILIASIADGELDLYYYGELTEDGKISFWVGIISCLFFVFGVIDFCELLHEKLKGIEAGLWAMSNTPAATSGDKETQTTEAKSEPAEKSTEPAVNKVKMRDINNGWKCVCCGQANTDDDKQCIECGTAKYEPRTAIDDARQARIINGQVTCPVCDTMQGTFRNMCRNCGTKFVSTEALERHLKKNEEKSTEKTWQCQFCDQENTGSMEYCAFCGVERKVIK